MQGQEKSCQNIEIDDSPVIREESIQITITRENSQGVEQKNPKNKYIKKRIKCVQCDKQFNKKENFKVHMKKVHEVLVVEDEHLDLVS